MKLFTRYFRINLLATLLIFLLASIAFYFLLWWVMIKQVDEDLKIEEREIETYISKYHRPPEPITVKDQRISYEPAGRRDKVRYFNTIKSPDEHEPEDFRQISFTLPAGNQWLLLKYRNPWKGRRT